MTPVELANRRTARALWLRSNWPKLLLGVPMLALLIWGILVLYALGVGAPVGQ